MNLRNVLKPAPDGRQFSFIKGGLSLAALALLLLSLLWPAHWALGSGCWFHRMTGWPCPGCGLTRAFRALAHGDFPGAWQLNPFAFLFYGFFLLLALEPLLNRDTDRNCVLRWSGWRRVGPLAAGALMLFWVCRIALHTGG